MWKDVLVATFLLVWVAGFAVALGSIGVVVWGLVAQMGPSVTLRAVAWACAGCGAMAFSLIATTALLKGF